MIKTEKEYLEAKKRLEQEFSSIEQQRQKLKAKSLSDELVAIALDPLTSFSQQLQEEIIEYEKLKRGDFEVLENFHGLGRYLVALRIFRGMKQKDLANKLEVAESQISRDENNEYHGASIEKVQKVLDALDITLLTRIDSPHKKVV